MIGPHLMLDTYGCEREKLENMGVVASILDELPSVIDMTKLMPPYVFKYPARWRKIGGVSGVILVAEGHISIHTFPKMGYLSLDIFSCNDFNVDCATEFIVTKFKVSRYAKKLVTRGREFP